MYTNIEVHGVDILPDNSVPDFYVYKCLDLDKKELPYPDKYFDAVLFTHVIEHLHSPFQLGKELDRVMKEGAKIYIEAPNWTTLIVPSFGFHREQHNPFNSYDDPTHVKPWNKQGLFEFLKQGCNCRVLKLGNTRRWLEVPFDLLIVPFALLVGNQSPVDCFFILELIWLVHLRGRQQRSRGKRVTLYPSLVEESAAQHITRRITTLVIIIRLSRSMPPLFYISWNGGTA